PSATRFPYTTLFRSGDDLLRLAVRQGEEDEVEAVAAVGVVLLERQVAVGGGQARVEVCDGPAGLRVAGREPDVEGGVRGAQPQQLGPGEPRGPDDPDRWHPDRKSVV